MALRSKAIFKASYPGQIFNKPLLWTRMSSDFRGQLPDANDGGWGISCGVHQSSLPVYFTSVLDLNVVGVAVIPKDVSRINNSWFSLVIAAAIGVPRLSFHVVSLEDGSEGTFSRPHPAEVEDRQNQGPYF